MDKMLFTSESVTCGHPDKVCDQVADKILDELLAQDPDSRVACEVTCAENQMHIFGEITSEAKVNYRAVAQQVIAEIGYTKPGRGFDADTFDPALWTTGISFQQYDDYPAISTALSAGEVDAFCVDKSILAIYKTDGRSYIDDKFSPQEYGVATTKGSGFSAYVDELVQGWLADGTIDSLITENGLE